MTRQDSKSASNVRGGHAHAHGDHAHAHGDHGHAHGPARQGHGPEHSHGSGTSHGFTPGGPGSNTTPLARGAGRGKMVFLQLPTGIAGDMTIAALLDLGVPTSVVSETVSALGFDDVRLVVQRGYAGSITCTHFDVQCAAPHPERSYMDIVGL
ncbi:MAG TPA: nickel insertion protein, partial [Polyangiaceae bacterium]|nr:nickel insertion protein [Polyangiaceae bacterium]